MALDLFVPVPVDSVPQAATGERRTHSRRPPTELQWIREVRLKYGPPVSLVNLSPGGMLLRSPAQLRPGVTMVLEIVTNRIEAVPFRVLRCEVAELGQHGTIYRGACQFSRPISLAGRGESALATDPRLDLTLRRLLVRHRQEIAAGARDRQEWAARLPRILRSMQSVATLSDPLSRGVCDILSEVVPALDRGEPAVSLRARLEAHLRRVVPELALAIGASPSPGPEGTETIYFSAGGATDPQAVLNVTLPEGVNIPDWQFRLLQAGSYLLEVVSSVGAGLQTRAASRVSEGLAVNEARGNRVIVSRAGDGPSAQLTRGWQKIVVRYRDERILKGFTHDFHPSRTQFSLWSSVHAAPSERKHIPVSQLKAVFFVRDFDGDPLYEDPRTFDTPTGAGRRLEVTFADGELLVGTTLSYSPDGIGFFVVPADAAGNNERIFVVTAAIRHVRFV